MTRRILVFDTTLRDGEQSPGFSMNIKEKLTLAKQLARLGVDVIEAGFPVSSDGDFEAVRTIAREVRRPSIAGLARALPKDIDRCWEAIAEAAHPRIHTFIATSDIHIELKFKTTRREILRSAVKAVRRARDYTGDVEFSAEDAFRSDIDFLVEVVQAAVDAGATTVNIPDTVGYAIPSEFGDLIATLRERVPAFERDVVLSVHCHNDLGLGVANSLAAVQNGAGQVECTVNGIGERAGNASLEEVVMSIATRPALFRATTGIRTEEIHRTSRLLSNITGIDVQPNKAIVGRNAFAHEAGIHQDGVLKDARTYEIMTPESVGLSSANLVLGKHSGRHAFQKRLQNLGYKLTKTELDKAFARFKELCDKKKEVFDEDLITIIDLEIVTIPEVYSLEYFNTNSGDRTVPTATVILRRGAEAIQDSATGDGPVDAAYRAVERITGRQGRLLSYSIRAVTSGKDALGEALIKVDFDGTPVSGKHASTDVIEASLRAYLNATNRMLALESRRPPGRRKPKKKPEGF